MKSFIAVLSCFTLFAMAASLPDCRKGQKDQYGCVQWKNKGYCKPSSAFYSFVSRRCPVACGICKVPPPQPPSQPGALKECREDQKDQYGCVQWENKGYCKPSSAYYSFVSSKCPAACGICKARPPPPPQIVNVDVNGCLGAHNAKRQLHTNTPNLSWDSNLSAQAAQFALKLATADSFEHSDGNYGENLYKSRGASASNCRAAVQSWYDEIKDYDYQNPRFHSKTGHFTQLVWKSTTKVGVGIATATHNGALVTVVVARYTPGGNDGRYWSNVMPLK